MKIQVAKYNDKNLGTENDMNILSANPRHFSHLADKIEKVLFRYGKKTTFLVYGYLMMNLTIK